MWYLWGWVKYLGCGLSLEAYLQIDDIILDNNLGLNLYVVIILDD